MDGASPDAFSSRNGKRSIVFQVCGGVVVFRVELGLQVGVVESRMVERRLFVIHGRGLGCAGGSGGKGGDLAGAAIYEFDRSIMPAGIKDDIFEIW